MRRRTVYRFLAVTVFVVEILIATVFAQMPFVRGSLGDVLAVVLLYVAALSVRDFERVRLAAAVFAIGCAVEVAQYFHAAQALGLRPGGILWIALGTTFQASDIACYFVGSVAALGVDLLTLRQGAATAAPDPR